MPRNTPKRDTFNNNHNPRQPLILSNLTADYNSKEYTISIDGQEFKTDNTITIAALRNHLTKWLEKRRVKDKEAEIEAIKNRDNPARVSRAHDGNEKDTRNIDKLNSISTGTLQGVEFNKFGTL